MNADRPGRDDAQRWMQATLTRPFGCPEIATFADVLPEDPSGPMIECFRAIDEAVDDKGLKLTQKGNVPRIVARDAAQRALGPEGYRDFTKYGDVNRERDFPPLVITHQVALRAGLLCIRLGRLHRTRRCEALLREGSYAAIYRPLFEAVTKFELAVFDRLPRLPIVQTSFLHSLCLLQRHGDEWRPTRFYEELFVRAFPAALAECPDSEHFSALDLVTRTYRVRFLERFAEFCGLVEVDPQGSARLSSEDQRVRKTPLLDQLVQFHVAVAGGDPKGAPANPPRDRARAEPFLELRVSLLGVRPAVWRRIRIRGEATFWDLHVAIQDSMGWDDTHLHVFRVVDRETRREREFGIPDAEHVGVEPGWTGLVSDFLDPSSRPVALYEYDFGDGWLHEIVLEDWGEAETGPLPACLDGERRCPPEDVGGTPGYQELLAALADRDHPEHARYRRWAGSDFDPEDFDPTQVTFRDPQAYWHEVFEDDGPEEGLASADDETSNVVSLFTALVARDPLVARAAELLGAEAEDIVRYQTLGRRFREERERRGLTIKELSRELKVPQYRLKAVEGSGTRSLEPKVLRKYAALLGLERVVEQWKAENGATAARLGV